MQNPVPSLNLLNPKLMSQDPQMTSCTYWSVEPLLEGAPASPPLLWLMSSDLLDSHRGPSPQQAFLALEVAGPHPSGFALVLPASHPLLHSFRGLLPQFLRRVMALPGHILSPLLVAHQSPPLSPLLVAHQLPPPLPANTVRFCSGSHVCAHR